jgi:hypothetical protein
MVILEIIKGGNMNTAPTIMVSSTFYDLHQIRADLSSFISNDLGFIPLLSELPSFPVDPDINTVENCRLRVEKNADILVLVVGGRYGSIDKKSDKSITNLEFLAARAKGIPVYVFVTRSILSIIPVWKKNQDGDFSDIVDTPKLFEFIELIRSEERVWTFEFDTAQDIINTLRLQLAYIFQESLKLRNLLSGSGIPRFMETLRPKAIRIALEKPNGWEYRLFFQSWIDEVESHKDIIREYKTGLQLESVNYFPGFDALEWIQTQLYEITILVNSANTLINQSIQVAFGKPGEPGDAEQIVWVSHMIGRILERTIQWAIKIRCARFDPPFDLLIPKAALIADDLISQFELFPNKALQKIDTALSLPKTDPPIKLELTMILEITNITDFLESLEEVKRRN